MTDSADAMEEELVDFSGSEYEFDADLVLEEEEDASTSIKKEALDTKNVVAGKTGDHLPGIQDTEKEFLDDVPRVNDIPSNNRCELPANPVGENSKEAQANGDPAQQSAGEAVDRSAAATADLEDGEFDDKASLRTGGDAWAAPSHAKAAGEGEAARAGDRPVERGHKVEQRGNRKKDEELESRRAMSDLDRGKRSHEREVEREEAVKRPRASPSAAPPISSMLGNLAGVRVLPQDLLRLQGQQQGLVGLMGRAPLLPLDVQRGLRAGAFPFGQLPGVVRNAGIQELLAREKLAAKTQQQVRNLQLEGQPMRPPPPPQQLLPGREYFPTHQPPPRRNGRPVPAVEDSRPMGHSRVLAGRNDELDGRKGGGPGDGLLGPNPTLPMGPPMSGGGGPQVQGVRGGVTYHGRRDVESGRGEGWGEGRMEREGGGREGERRVRGEDGGGSMILEESRGVVAYGEGERRKDVVGDRRLEDGRDGRHEAGAGAGRGPPSMGREEGRGPVLRDGRGMGVADRVVTMGGGRVGAPSAEQMREERGSERGVMRDDYREVEGRPRVGNNGREEERRRDGERRGFDDDRGWGRAQRDVAFGGRAHENMGSRREEQHLKPSPVATWGSAEVSGRAPGGGPGSESRNSIQMGLMVRGSRVADTKEHRGEWGGGEWGAAERRAGFVERPPRSPDLPLNSGSARTDVLRYVKEGEEQRVRDRSRDRVTKFSPPTLHPRGVPPPPGADARYPERGGGPVRERQRRETQFSGPPPGLQRFNHPSHPIPSLEVSPAGGWSGERVIHGGGGPRAERPERGSGFNGGFQSGPPSAELARMRDEGSGRGGGGGVRLGAQEGGRPRPRTGFPSPLPPPPHSMPRFLPQGLPPGPSQLREWEREERGGDRGRGRGRGGGRGGGDGRDERDGGRMAGEGGRQDPNRMHNLKEPRYQGGRFSHITPALRPPYESFTDPNLKGRRLM